MRGAAQASLGTEFPPLRVRTMTSKHDGVDVVALRSRPVSRWTYEVECAHATTGRVLGWFRAYQLTTREGLELLEVGL